MTDRPDHARLREVFLGACDLPAAERAEYLATACGDDQALRDAVERLLAQDRDGDEGFAGSNAPDQPEQPERIGPFRVLGLIGEGGMGRVYLAEQDKPRRRVAVKVLRAGLASAANRRRFEHEAEVLGRLQHRGIAQVIEFGMAAGLGEPIPFLAMEFVDGVPFREAVIGMAIEERITLFLAVCDAVEHAHRHGVIHRDLKPENVLVVDGQPKVLDFGIARVHGEASREQMTMTGQIVGTLAYMSPEQVRGEVDLDTRSDVYALGVLLYELLAGRLPLETDRHSFVEALRIVQDVAPRTLGAIAPECRGDLEVLVGKCLEKDPERRYAGVGALAADARRFLAKEPIEARSPTTWYQLRKFAARHRVSVAAGVVVTLALVVGFVATLVYANRAERLRIEGLHDTYRATIAAAYAAIASDPHRAKRSAEAAPESLRGFEWRLLAAALDRSCVATGDAFVVRRSGVAGDRVMAAVVAGGEVVLHDVSAGEVIARVPTGLPDAAEPRLSANGRRVLVGAPALPGLRLLATDGAVVRDFFAAEPTAAQALLSPDGATLLSCHPGRAIELLPAGAGTARTLPTAMIAGWSADGTRVLRGRAASLHLHDAVTGRLMRELRHNGLGPSAGPMFAEDAGEFVIGSLRLLELRDADSLELIERVPVDRHLLAAVACDRSARRLAASSKEPELGTTRLFDREQRHQSAVHGGGAMRSLAFDESTGLWFGANGAGVRPFSPTVGRGRVLGGDRTHDSFVYKASFSAAGRRIVTSGWDGKARVFDAWDGRLLATIASFDWASGIAFLDEDTVAILHPTRESVRRCSLTTGESSVAQVAERWAEIAPIGARTVPFEWHAGLAAVVFERGVELTAVKQGIHRVGPDGEHRPFLEVDSGVVALAWRPERRALVFATENGRLQHWRVPVGDGDPTCVLRRTGLTGLAYALDISPDGSRVAIGLDTGTIELWDLPAGRQLVELTGHDNYVHDVEFSPDGTQLVSASGDGTVRIWDTKPLAQRMRDAWDW
ncbi:MAG: serine/threonine-protein kinase [bacterium]|nr:serine/threonine-protein kinase [bacterium]